MRRSAAAVGILAAVLILAAAILYYHRTYQRATPASQPALARLDKDDIDPVRELFNASAGSPRLLVMLSPT